MVSKLALVFGPAWLLCCAAPAAADSESDQQVVEEYLKGRGANGAVVRPITDDPVGRTFPGFRFFGVIFRQYPVAVQCPQAKDLNCSNVFVVQDGRVEVIASVEDLRFFFSAEVDPAAPEEEGADAASAWLRLSAELKQDLFYEFSAPEIARSQREDATKVRGRTSVSAGGEGQIDVVMLFGSAGSLIAVQERSRVRPGVRPICQATKLLDRDPIVRRMAEQDILVMGRAARPYLDSVRATAKLKLQQAIDRVWRRILTEGR